MCLQVMSEDTLYTTSILLLVHSHLDSKTGGSKELNFMFLVSLNQIPAEVPGLGRQLSQSQPLVSLLQLVWCRCGLVELKQELIIKVMMFMMMMIMLGMIISV